MSLSRRSIFGLFAGAPIAALAAKAAVAAPLPDPAPQACRHAYGAFTAMDGSHTHNIAYPSDTHPLTALALPSYTHSYYATGPMVARCLNCGASA